MPQLQVKRKKALLAACNAVATSKEESGIIIKIPINPPLLKWGWSGQGLCKSFSKKVETIP